MRSRARTSFILKVAMLFLGCFLVRYGAILAGDHHVSSKTVKEVQTELKQKGYHAGEVDGVLGAQTRASLRRYQKEQGLTGDGRLTHETAVHLGVAKKGSDPSPGEHFEDAGAEIKEHYGKGGKALGKGAKEMGKDVKEGEVTDGAKDLGKGAGKFGKEVGKGTAKAAKKVGKGVKDAVDGDDDKKEKKEKP
ncbi:MAG: peptidoglycan-binding protein [Acidobacteria bacterium]|nr:peptidoglycan-binding protein [Acidobacteriota bacterium]MCI0721960.1 peptidoglycan-binding protein [Acidobacteriota bacterium]